MKKIKALIYLFLGVLGASGQSITLDPSNSSGAIIESKSNNQGVILSRMNTAERKAIPNPKSGTLVFDTDKSRYFLYDGNTWLALKLDLETDLSATERTMENVQGNIPYIAVAIDKKWAAVGLSTETVNGLNSKGAVLIFEKTIEGWIQKAKISPTDGQANDGFGESVALKGDSLMVGARNSANANGVRGAVYFYRNITTYSPYTGTLKFWNQQAKIQSNINSTTHSNFGQEIQFDQNHLAVSTNGEDGIVYIYNNTGQGYTFAQTIQIPSLTLNTLGRTISLSGDYLAIGAPYNKNESNMETGAVYIFVKGGGTWTLQESLYGNTVLDRFGTAVCLNDNVLFVGIPKVNTDQGRVHYFLRNGSSWNLKDVLSASQAYLTPVYQESLNFGSKLVAYDDWLFVSSLTSVVSVFKRNELGFYRLYDSINCKKYPSADVVNLATDGTSLIIGNYENKKVKFVNFE
ncbi:MAG TPA: hypothetical protein VK175_18230 [Leadbetterella sp.]|nr:hypothetical protein [Leadbetterella sp.]